MALRGERGAPVQRALVVEYDELPVGQASSQLEARFTQQAGEATGGRIKRRERGASWRGRGDRAGVVMHGRDLAIGAQLDQRGLRGQIDRKSGGEGKRGEFGGRRI